MEYSPYILTVPVLKAKLQEDNSTLLISFKTECMYSEGETLNTG